MVRRIRTKTYNVKERKDEIKQAIKELIKSGVENKNLFGKEYAMIYTDGHVGMRLSELIRLKQNPYDIDGNPLFRSNGSILLPCETFGLYTTR